MKLKTHWPLLCFLCGFEGWILTFPLFGPMLVPFSLLHGVRPERIVPIFLLFFSLSYVCWGFLLYKYPLNGSKLNWVLKADITVCLALGLSLLWVPAHLWGVLFAAIGMLGALPSLVWLSAVTQHPDTNSAGWNLGITGFFMELIVYLARSLANHVHPATGFLIVDCLLLIPLWILIRNPGLFHLQKADIRVSSGLRPGAWALFPLIFVLYLVGGVMYQVVVPFLAGFPQLATYGVLPYILTMPFVGLLADRYGIRPLTLLGIVTLGLAYTLFALSDSITVAVLGSTFLNIGFAFLDLFVLFGLSRYAPRQAPALFIGCGLGVYTFSILSGVWLTRVIVPFSKGNYLLVFLTAIFILFVSFVLAEWVGKKEPRHEPGEIDPGKAAYYSELDQELQLAYQVQQNILPKPEDFPVDWDVAATLEVAREIGGDFYDVLPLSDSRTLFVIGDVMGKGLPAALIVSSLVGQIRSVAHADCSLTDLLQHVNQVLIRDARFSMYVTMGLAIVDQLKGTLTYASAGHLFPYLITSQGVQPIELCSLPLGADLEVVYEQAQVPFGKDDLLLLYTDGLVEAKNEHNEFYGFERLEQKLRQNLSLKSADELGQILLTDVRSFIGQQVYEDDLTLLIVRRLSRHLTRG